MQDWQRHVRVWWHSLVVADQAGALVLRGSGAGFLRFLFLTIALLYAVYGFSMGLFAGVLPAFVSMLKLPALYLCSIAVSVPSLYALNCLLGPRLHFDQCLRLVLLSISANAVALGSYAPVSYFFVLTSYESTYFFLIMMHVAVFALSGFLSVGVILMISRATARVGGTPFHPGIMLAWGIIYGLVGSQMSWFLRPWVGSPAEAYTLFRPIQSSFLETLWRLVLELLGMQP
ncbi:MAG: hypothetical protein HYV26_22765 [Candidatus Hydrogenedentes bacterium]|nr:hypothetical protein [Candidatus Hydrogenedentota bacterium]